MASPSAQLTSRRHLWHSVRTGSARVRVGQLETSSHFILVLCGDDDLVRVRLGLGLGVGLELE
jgi:hypothetical protein